MKRILPLLCLALLYLAGCNPLGPGALLVDPVKEKVALGYIDELMAGRAERIIADLDPSLRTEDIGARFDQMHSLFPSGAPTSRELVGYQWQKNPGTPTQYNLTYQYGFGGKWLMVNVAFREPASGSRVVYGMHVVPLPASLQETNCFTFSEKGMANYVFFAAAMVIPLFVIGTLVVCVRTPIPRRKWLWVVFILLGFVQFSLDWTSGQWGIQPIAFQICGASFMRSCDYAPWILSFSLPIGAIVFWLRRGRYLRPSEPPPMPPTLNA